MDDQPVSRRVAAIASARPFGLLFAFFRDFNFGERRQRPGVLDFTFGDPHEMPSGAYVDALAASLTPRDELWFAYKQNEPTPATTLQRLAAMLDDASARDGRRICLLSDEPCNRIVYNGARPNSPLRYYPHSFLAYSYGKTLLAPGQRMGYLALPPTMPDRPAMRQAIETLQIATGYVFPNAVLQHALPNLEELSFDIALFQRKRDRLVSALREIGYRVNAPEGAFYLFPESPIPDDGAFTELLAKMGVLVFPGRLFETPGFFRISLTATLETIEASLPRFAEAFATATSVDG